MSGKFNQVSMPAGRRAEYGDRVCFSVVVPHPLYVSRERHFGPAGNTVVSVAPIDIVVVAYGGGDKPEHNAKAHGGFS
jgi:hypothetical protein